MRLHFVGTKMSSDGKLLGYQILDDITQKIKILKKKECIELMNTKEIGNISIDKGEIKTNGDMKRYHALTAGKYTPNPIVILKRLLSGGKVTGYVVYIDRSGIYSSTTERVIAAARDLGIANGKIVEKDGKAYIASISGEFETVEFNDLKPQLDQKMDEAELVQYLMYRGLQINARKGKIEIAAGNPVAIENLSMPVNSGHIYFSSGVVLKIKNLSLMGGNTHLTFMTGTQIENLRFVGEGHSLHNIEISGAVVNRCISSENVESLRAITLNGAMRAFIGGEKLNIISNSFNGYDIQTIDLRKCESELGMIDNSFNGCGNNAVNFHPGKFIRFDNVLMKDKVKLDAFFNVDAEKVNGFDEIVGIEKLDFSKFMKLRHLGGMKNTKCKELLLPVNSGVYMNYDFCRSAEMEEVYIHDCDNQRTIICSGALLNTKVVSVPPNTEIDSGSVSDRTTVFVVRKRIGTKISGIPRMGGDNANIVFEEGIEELLELNKISGVTWVGSIKLPKSLKVIGSNAFKYLKIGDINLEETSVEKIGDFAFLESEITNSILFCPETLKSIGERAFYSRLIDMVYVTEGVNEIGNYFFRGTVLYLHKGSYIDKSKSGAYAKVYVNGLKNAMEIIESKNSTQREIAKVVMAVGGNDDYKWLKEERFKGHGKFILEVIRELEREERVDRGLVLDKSKYIDFPLKNLGFLGEEIQEVITTRALRAEGHMLTDQFRIVSNLITANTEFYAGHFTSKALKEYGLSRGEVKKYINTVPSFIVYADKISAVYAFSIKTSADTLSVPKAHAYVIIINGKIVYTTIVKENHLFKANMYLEGYHSGVEEYLKIGDSIQRFRGSTLGLKELPEEVGFKLDAYYEEYTVELGKATNSTNEKRLLSYNTGKTYELKYMKKHWTVKKIESAEVHKYKAPGIFEQEGVIRYFDLINGAVKAEIKEFKTEKSKMLEIIEGLRDTYEFDDDAVLEEIVKGLDLPLMRLHFDKVRYSDRINEKYRNVTLYDKKAIDKVGYRRNGCVYGYAENEALENDKNATSIEMRVGAYDLSRLGEIWKDYRLDPSKPEPEMFKTLENQEFKETFLDYTLKRGEVSVAVARNNGYAYLLHMFTDITSGNNWVERYTVLGLLRNEEEALRTLHEKPLNYVSAKDKRYGMIESVGIEPFKLADKARRGEIPVGAHPEYTINTHKIFEVLGL